MTTRKFFSKALACVLSAALVAIATSASLAGTINFDFSDAVAGSVPQVTASGANLVYTINDLDAGSYTLTVSGASYDTGRGGGFRNSSSLSENDLLLNFAVSGLNAGYQVTDFGVGYVAGAVAGFPNNRTTFSLSIDAGGPTLASATGINGPSPNNQTNNDMLGILLGSYGNAPTFRVFIDEATGSTSPDILQINGLTISVAPVAAVPEPASIAIWSLLAVALTAFGACRLRRK